MTDFYYRLEILPTEEGREFYTNISHRENDNAGYDLYVSTPAEVSIYETPLGVTLLKLGCKARLVKCYADEMEEDVHFFLAPRSSIWKSGVVMANSMGIIDRSYRGELMAAVYAYSGTASIGCGTRLVQILAPDMGHIKEVRIVDTLPETKRGEGGFGSTGIAAVQEASTHSPTSSSRTSRARCGSFDS